MDTLPAIAPDRNLSQTPSFAIDEVSFGDGYVQARPSGINSVKESYQVNWSLLTKQEYDTLYGFLKSRQGVTPFLWQPPWRTSPIKWRCKNLSGNPARSAVYGSITATFEQDHNP